MQLPKHVEIIEVGPRDGFQSIKEFIPTQTKLEIIDTLLEAGIQEIELTSFVNPKAIAQMADASEIVQTILNSSRKPVRPIALVPNLKGAQNAYECGIRVASLVISVSESHNKANVNRTIAESFADFKNIITEFSDLKIRLDIATAFGCPFEGFPSEKNVIDLMKQGINAGAAEIVICDTIGIANPQKVSSLCEKVLQVSSVPIALHFHDTRGMGLANILAGFQSGIFRFETSVGGLGGCPFAPGAAGNTASEDAVNMFASMGIDLGLNLVKYLSAVDIVKKRIKPDLTSRMGFAHLYEFENPKSGK